MTLNLRTSLFASGLVALVSAAQPAFASSIVTEWLDQTIPAAKQTAWEPTVSARFFALVHAAMYDAWTAYDPVAVGVFTGTSLRGTGGPSTVVRVIKIRLAIGWPIRPRCRPGNQPTSWVHCNFRYHRTGRA